MTTRPPLKPLAKLGFSLGFTALFGGLIASIWLEDPRLALSGLLAFVLLLLVSAIYQGGQR